MQKINKLNKPAYLLTLLYLTVLVCQLFAASTLAQGGREVLVIVVDGPVTHIMLSFIKRAIEQADVRNAEALVIRLNTPGGSVDLTKEIIQAMVAADVPIVVYVWPPGGFAASAGTFITLAGHAAAMAPNTSIGAASPVDGSGGDIDETLRAKIENILVADIKGMDYRHGVTALEGWQQAIDVLRQAKTFSPNGFNYRHRVTLANALLEAGKGNDAVIELRTILDHRPDQI